MEEHDINNLTEIKKTNNKAARKPEAFLLLIPLLLSVWMFIGFSQIVSSEKDTDSKNVFDPSESIGVKFPQINYLALITKEQFAKDLRDTVYTDMDKWLELRIDEQTLYVHYRDGHIIHYPVSSGNKYLNKGIESRPGLFAIFMKEELHLSSQFDDAKMFYYMPFNMGIGFHSLAGTGYYSSLGVRPASHGCIRMRHEDAKKLFGECPLGTLVLAHRGNSARVIGFAPAGFKNDKDYTKEDYQNLLAYDLNSLYEGKYFINPPKRFIIDPAVIPRIGFNIGSTDNIPDKQQVPFMVSIAESRTDKLNQSVYAYNEIKEQSVNNIEEYFGLSGEDTEISSETNVSPELVKKLVYNPGGILPYFPPDKDN
jgi:hypothetical protein